LAAIAVMQDVRNGTSETRKELREKEESSLQAAPIRAM
jgi:hypothetical protein